jgi:hypothetical protein
VSRLPLDLYLPWLHKPLKFVRLVNVLEIPQLLLAAYYNRLFAKNHDADDQQPLEVHGSALRTISMLSSSMHRLL